MGPPKGLNNSRRRVTTHAPSSRLNFCVRLVDRVAAQILGLHLHRPNWTTLVSSWYYYTPKQKGHGMYVENRVPCSELLSLSLFDSKNPPFIHS